MLVSINDTPEIRAAFAWAEIREVETRYHISGNSQVVRELLIGRGVDLDAVEPQRSLF